MDSEHPPRFRAYQIKDIPSLIEAHPRFMSVAAEVVHLARVFPFRVSNYFLQNLVNWEDPLNDPLFKLVFPMTGMLSEENEEKLLAVEAQGDPILLKETVKTIRKTLNPQPAGQLTHNRPKLDGRVLQGMQHKYPETLLIFPHGGQTCHSYCTYCFRWAQFIGEKDFRLDLKMYEEAHAYLANHDEVTDILLTGGDPMVLRTKSLNKLLSPFKDPNYLPNVSTIRIGTRALTYWPHRFTTDKDASGLLELFRGLKEEGGRHLALMAHLSHPRELEPAPFLEAVRAIQSSGAVIRSQSPLLRGINDDAEIWARKWRGEVNLGIVPYYMFVARDTGPQEHFEVSLADAHEIFQRAWQKVSGLGRTVRGPSMSCTPGKVEVLGTQIVDGEKAFVLRFIQCRIPSLVDLPFFAKFDDEAYWYDQLKPLRGRELPWDDSGWIIRHPITNDSI